MPQSDPKARKREQANLDSTLNVLFLAIFPLLLWVFQGTFTGVATSLLAIWLFSLGLRFIGRGQSVANSYHASPNAQRPRLPRKLIGSILIGAVAVILAGHKFADLFLPLLIGLVAICLSLAAFGLDPMPRKEEADSSLARQLEIANSLEICEKRLSDIMNRLRSLEDSELVAHTAVAQDMITGLLRENVQNIQAFERAYKPSYKFVDLLEQEITQLELQWDGEDEDFARNHYVTKLQVMIESFSEKATQSGYKIGQDRFERQADRLLDRMPEEHAA